MKTGTSCAKCARARFCANYDSRVLYGFCQRFVAKGDQRVEEDHICRNCTDWAIDKTVNYGRVGECHNPDVLAEIDPGDGWAMISVCRAPNEGKSCKYWRARNGR